MTELKQDVLKIRGHKVGKASWYPGIRELIKSEISAKLDEDDALFIGYGMMSDLLPYTFQDDYDNEEEELSFQAVILENEYLKAVFLPELGGRLWSLFDKENNKDLILANTKFLPCNLGIRNAWFAGGVEFNCGRRGHDEQTVSPRYAAIVDHPDFPVLRIYEYQRDRGTPFQYDCFLPEGSRFLYIRGRIYNPNKYTVPMYWWSNIAVAEVEGSRVVVPAKEVFANWYSNGSHALAKLPLPSGEGFDGTYPVNFQYVKDHFYNIPEDRRRYECLFMPDGYGFCHVSTKRMRGRKLFVWGQSPGGRHWNKKLLGPGLDNYIELQGGLGRSQQECLPMPPETAWEWLEGYGNMNVAPEKVFCSWDEAVKNTTEEVDRLIPEQQLEDLLHTTRQSIALRKGKIITEGSGWGTLEEKRMGRKLADQLDFTSREAEQLDWYNLLDKNRFEEKTPFSYLITDEWFALIKNAEESWQKHYHMALYYFRKQDWERSENEVNKALCTEKNRHLLHLLANIRRKQEQPEEAANCIFNAGKLDLQDASFIKEVLKMLLESASYEKMTELLSLLSADLLQLPLIRFMQACALAHTGKLQEAEDILLEDESWEIPDIREGENSTSSLYLYIQEKKAERENRTFDRQKCSVPFFLDLRMSES
ncbi:MAG: DUF5107 domain-containing protein [Lentisphaeria bacterium]|nr:DUF5107 domain-containing protein [Lentisphaeria bacterium]